VARRGPCIGYAALSIDGELLMRTYFRGGYEGLKSAWMMLR
jgi:hypothetical protein